MLTALPLPVLPAGYFTSGATGTAGSTALLVNCDQRLPHRSICQDLRCRAGAAVAFVTSWQACGDDYLCVAKRGYDAPTGLGTPDGTGAF